MKPISRTLGGLLDELATRYQEKHALLFRDERITFNDFKTRVDDLAKGLVNLGVERGDRIGLLMSNRSEWLITAFAAFKIGAIVVGINTWYKKKDLKYVLENAEVKTVVCMDYFLKNDYVQMITEICPEIQMASTETFKPDNLPTLKNVIVLGSNIPKGAYSFDQIEETGSNLSEPYLQRSQVDPHDVALILYTSGTTAFPKGVTLLHNGLIENGYNIGGREHLTDTDRLWLGVPLFFSFASANAIMAILTHGGSIAIQEHFEASEALSLIQDTRCTVYYGMPIMTKKIYEHPDRQKYDISSLQKGATIGPSKVVRETIDFIPFVSNVYGATETYGNCCVIDGHDDIEKRVTSQGKPLPGMSIKIVDSKTRRELSRGEIGEVCVKGYITPGYYNDEKNNRKAFDGEGFYITGDLGYLDKEGYFYYVNRVKDMIKTGGINVSPLAVEECLYHNAKVKNAYVLGVPDSKKGEIVMAVIELKSGVDCTKEEIVDFCKRQLPGYSVPSRVEFWEDKTIPRTPTGKVSKQMLRNVIVNATEEVIE
jgi:fatty-acyl-CoA synthase